MSGWMALLPAFAWADLSRQGWAAMAYLAAVAVASVVCFAAFGWDKRQSRRGGWRVPEATLHLMELLGGWPGALAGQRVFRHKTRKRSYRITLGLIIVLHLLAVGYGLWRWLGRA